MLYLVSDAKGRNEPIMGCLVLSNILRGEEDYRIILANGATHIWAAYSPRNRPAMTPRRKQSRVVTSVIRKTGVHSCLERSVHLGSVALRHRACKVYSYI
jgi:hypothetical protein